MVKALIKIAVKAQKGDCLSVAGDLLAVGVFSDASAKSLVKILDRKLSGGIEKIKKLGDFEAKPGSSCLLYAEGRLGARRLLLLGLGKRKKVTADVLRKAAALAATKAVGLKAKSVLLSLHTDIPGSAKLDSVRIGQTLAEGACFGAYRYDEYLTDKNHKRPANFKVLIVDSDAAVVAKLRKGVSAGVVTGLAQNFARTIANRPANVINPVTLAAEAKKLAKRISFLRCTVLDDKQLKQKKMGGILAVGQGSATPPRLIVLHYTPASATKKTPTIGLVGKAVTFDSGGISLKPGAGMHDMKFDKSGGIAVLGAMDAIARLKPKCRVYGLIPAAENMPSGVSYRPGDIVTTYSGKTIEIQNTDAEGRMILCDAITYAENLGCKSIVDIATLTGACVVALGQKRAGLMSNDDKLVARLKKASDRTGERLWHLPCDDEFVEEMKSKIADLKNLGGKWGGACTAAAFLSQFVDKAQWAHIDMAGVGVWGAGENDAPGSIGFGVRLLTAFAMNYK
ncbi:MAG: leucyl aminopeptidase [Planctomycetales bacterium 4572_13]|nr:MAG: leucyl aminopeptidase [Planctomycetales bacterium 4572_13]